MAWNEDLTNNDGNEAARTVEDGTDDGAEDLHRERDARRQLHVLTELQVAQHENALTLRVLAVQRAIHVRDRIPWDEVGGDHLVEAVRGRAEFFKPNGGGESREQERHDQRDDQDDSQRPPRQAGVALVVGRLCDCVCPSEEDKVPPAGNRLVHLHPLVVGVMDNVGILVPGVERLKERLDILPVPEEDVGERSAKGKVRGDEVERVRSREERRL